MRRAQKQMQKRAHSVEKASDLGKENFAKLPRVCKVGVADDSKDLFRTSRMFAADFAPNARAPRAKQMQKCARLAGVHDEKHAILAQKLREVAPRAQRRRRQ